MHVMELFDIFWLFVSVLCSAKSDYFAVPSSNCIALHFFFSFASKGFPFSLLLLCSVKPFGFAGIKLTFGFLRRNSFTWICQFDSPTFYCQRNWLSLPKTLFGRSLTCFALHWSFGAFRVGFHWCCIRTDMGWIDCVQEKWTPFGSSTSAMVDSWQRSSSSVVFEQKHRSFVEASKSSSYLHEKRVTHGEVVQGSVWMRQTRLRMVQSSGQLHSAVQFCVKTGELLSVFACRRVILFQHLSLHTLTYDSVKLSAMSFSNMPIFLLISLSDASALSSLTSFSSL
jgi:hypothetical protein